MKKVTHFFGHLFERKKSRKKSVRRNSKRPVSVFESPSSPLTSRPSLPTSASLEDLIKQSQAEDEPALPTTPNGKQGTPLRAFPLHKHGAVTEKSKDGSIIYYRPRKDAMDKKTGQSEQRRASRDRVKSTEIPSTSPLHQNLQRKVTPSDPGDLNGLPHYNRTSGEWDNVPQPPPPGAESPPPIPVRRYLSERDDNDSIGGVARSDWSDEALRPQNPTPSKSSREIPFPQNTNLQQPLSAYPLKPSPQPGRRTHEQQYARDSPNRDPRNGNWSPMTRRELPTTPGSDNVFTATGSDNMAFVDERTHSPGYQVRDYRNIPMHQDAQRYRQANGDLRGRPMDNYDERQRQFMQQRNRMVNDVIQENIPLSNYDPSRVHLLPGVYLRPKPYYPNGAMQDRTKRYSDASDYSDMIYERQYYADRVSRDIDPYFFRSRWSMSPGQTAVDENLTRHRNSDFVSDETYIPMSRQQKNMQYRRSLIEEERYDSDIIREFPKPGRSRRLSSGYQSQGSKLDDQSLVENHHQQPANRPRHSNTAPNLPAVTIEQYPGDDQALLDGSRTCNGHYRPNSWGYPYQLRQQIDAMEYPPNMHPHLGPPIHHQPRANSGPLIHPPVQTYQIAPLSQGEQPSLRHQNVPVIPPSSAVAPATHENRVPLPPSISPPIPPRSVSQTPATTQVPSSSQETSNQSSTSSNEIDQSVAQHQTQSSSSPQSPLKTKESHIVDESVASPSVHPPLSKQISNEYGSLIDVLYRYKQSVRSSRQKEMPKESPESRLKFEREKLKSKLKNELGPRHRQSNNLDMVIETLLYLCETGDGNTLNNRSWQREHSEHSRSKSRSNSAIFLSAEDTYHCDETDENPINKAEDKLKSTAKNGEENSETKSQVSARIGQTSVTPPPFQRRPRRHDYQEIVFPKTAPAVSSQTEFPFPSEEEVDRILKQSDPTPPPVPLRRNRKTTKVNDSDPSMSPKSPASGGTGALHIHSNAEYETERDRTKLRNRVEIVDQYGDRRKHRRSSLPSMHFTESELKWLEDTGVKDEKVHKHRGKFEGGGRGNLGPKFKSTRPRRDSQRFVLNPKSRLVVHQKSLEDEEQMPDRILSLDDMQIDEKTDAEDIMTEITRRMSERNDAENGATSPKQSPHNVKRSAPSDSDMGTWSSAASNELPAPPRRRLNRSEGKYPSSDNTPMTSPIHMHSGFHTPPPDGSRLSSTPSPTIPQRTESLSPVRIQFQTPPSTPRTQHKQSPLTQDNRSASASNVARTGLRSPSPKAQLLTPTKALAQFNPRKQPQRSSPVPHQMKPTRKPSLKPGSPASAPVTPSIKSKLVPIIPFPAEKKFVKSVSDDSPARWDETKRTSRKGEIITLPDDDVYSIPWDCKHPDVTNIKSSSARDITNYRVTNGQQSYGMSRHKSSPGLAFSHGDNNRFFPIQEQVLGHNSSDYDDYAVPVNSPPTSLSKRKKLSRSTENILKDYGTAL